MRRIRGRDTKPEMLIRRALFKLGYRYRINYASLPGKPDIVFLKWRIAVFIHGCFWHAHQNCIQASKPKTNTTYWGNKLAGNVARDERYWHELGDAGFRVLTLWECEIERSPTVQANRVVEAIESAKLVAQP